MFFSRAHLKNSSSRGRTYVLQIRIWCGQRINSFISLVLLIIEAKIVSRELLGSVERAWKTVRAFNGSLSSSLIEDRYFGKCSSEPMPFVNFSDFWSFGLFDNFPTFWQLFDNFLTDLPIIPSTSSYLTIICTSWWIRWWACLEHRGQWCNFLSKSLLQPSLSSTSSTSCLPTGSALFLPPSSTQSTSCLPTGSALFLPPSPTPTILFGGSALGTRDLHHWGKWCSYPAKLRWTARMNPRKPWISCTDFGLG